MKKILVSILVIIFTLVELSAVNADEDYRRGGVRAYIGLWETVDPLDGSLTQRSISCDWHTSTCDILGSDLFLGILR